MGDLKSSRLIIFKGFLFLVCGALAGLGLLVEHPEWRTAFLLAICVWSFCRFYYFAFYVVQNYVDPQFKFSSLFAFGIYLFRRQRVPHAMDNGVGDGGRSG